MSWLHLFRSRRTGGIWLRGAAVAAVVFVAAEAEGYVGVMIVVTLAREEIGLPAAGFGGGIVVVVVDDECDDVAVVVEVAVGVGNSTAAVVANCGPVMTAVAVKLPETLSFFCHRCRLILSRTSRTLLACRRSLQ